MNAIDNNIFNQHIPGIINHLAKVNRRYYIVGLFNGHPNHRDKLYYFGPNANKETLRTAIEQINDTKIVCDTQNSFDSFLDTVEPSVQESLTGGNNAIQIGAPVDQNSTGSVHKVNTFLLLYKDTKLPQGQELLKQLSDDVNLYLDLMRDVDQLVVAFNRFLYHHRENNIGVQRKQLPASGVKFHDNFAQILLQFLVLEQVDKLDYTSLNWDSFGSDWPQNEKEIFAKIVKDFRIALLNEKPNEIDDKLRTQFQQRRQALLRTGKTLQSKFMLSLLSYWIFNSLLGKKASDTNYSDYKNLFQHISAQDERQRKLQLPTTGQEVTLAAPRVTLEKE